MGIENHHGLGRRVPAHGDSTISRCCGLRLQPRRHRPLGQVEELRPAAGELEVTEVDTPGTGAPTGGEEESALVVVSDDTPLREVTLGSTGVIDTLTGQHHDTSQEVESEGDRFVDVAFPLL